MNEITLPSRHRIRNSNPDCLRPSLLLLDHGGSSQYWIPHIKRCGLPYDYDFTENNISTWVDHLHQSLLVSPLVMCLHYLMETALAKPIESYSWLIWRDNWPMMMHFTGRHFADVLVFVSKAIIGRLKTFETFAKVIRCLFRRFYSLF